MAGRSRYASAGQEWKELLQETKLVRECGVSVVESEIENDSVSENKPLADRKEVRKQDKSASSRDLNEMTESTPPMSRIGLNDCKAGMEGLDKAKINEIILEASKGSKFYNNEVKKEKQVSARIKHMMERMKTLTEAQKVSALKTVDKEIEALECSRDLSRIIVHIDMDAFYAAVEMRDNPQLRSVPMAVGGNSMLSTSNYVARKYGVRAAMPGFIARKLCPDLVIVPLNFAKYTAVSEEVREILFGYDPHFSPMGLDESYLDITEYVMEKFKQVPGNNAAQVPPRDVKEQVETCDHDLYDEGESVDCVYPSVDWWKENGVPSQLWDLAQDVVKEMREKIEQRTSLTASAGIAPNKMLAKIASDMNKPNGQYFLVPSRDNVLHFIHSLPIRKIPGIGKVTERMLNALNITTCQDLYDERALLHLLFSQISSHHFLRVCLGLGSTEVDKDYQRKSMSTERTFSEISKPEELMLKCKKLCDSLSESLAEEHLKGRTVTIKIKRVDFKVLTRAMSVKRPISSSEDLFQAASELLQVEINQASPKPLCLRLMGVRLSNLEEHTSYSITNFFKKTRHQEMSIHTDDSEDGYLSEDAILTVDTGSNLTPAKEDKPQTCGDDADLSHKRTLVLLDEPTSSTSTPLQTRCPVCGVLVQDDNAMLNQHIDICLNREAVTEVVKGTKPLLAGEIDSRDTNSSVVRNRKRKGKEIGKGTPSKSKKTKDCPPTMKLDHFFKI